MASDDEEVYNGGEVMRSWIRNEVSYQNKFMNCFSLPSTSCVYLS